MNRPPPVSRTTPHRPLLALDQYLIALLLLTLGVLVVSALLIVTGDTASGLLAMLAGLLFAVLGRRLWRLRGPLREAGLASGRELLERLPYGALKLDVSGNVEGWNTQFAELLGLPAFSGQQALPTLKQLPLPPAVLAALLHPERDTPSQIDDVQQERVLRWTLNAPPHSCALLLCEDVTEPHLLARRRAERDARLQAALRAGQLSIAEFDPANDTVTISADAPFGMLGLERDWMHKPLAEWMERIHPDDRILLKRMLASGSGESSLEVRVRHGSGQWEWLGMMVQDVRHDGHPRKVALCQLITARKQAASGLIQRELELRTLLENTPDIVARFDLELRCTFVNRSATRYLDLPRGEHLGRDLAAMGWPQAGCELFEQEAHKLIAQRQARTIELKLPQREGTLRFETRLLPEFDAHGVLQSILCVMRDVTEASRARRLLADEKSVLEMIARNAPLAEVMDTLCRMVEVQMDGAMCAVMVQDDSGSRLRFLAAPSLPEAFCTLLNDCPIAPSSASCGSAAYHNLTVIVDDLGAHPNWEPLRERVAALPLRAAWSFPVHGQHGHVQGTLDLYYREPRTPSPDDLRLAYRTTSLAAIALHHATHESRLYRMATEDALTGLANRRQLIEVLEKEFSRARRLDTPLAVLMFDLDHFKRINDTHGHAAGDEVLRHFARLCRDTLRGYDVIGRMGGEEFAAVLPGIGATDAMQAAERLRQATEQLRIPYQDVTLGLTTSVGAATLQDGDLSIDTLLARADKALYRAKAQGRNRSCGD